MNGSTLAVHYNHLDFFVMTAQSINQADRAAVSRFYFGRFAKSYFNHINNDTTFDQVSVFKKKDVTKRGKQIIKANSVSVIRFD